MKKKNTIKPKLIATIIAMVCALSFLAVGVMASLTNFQVAISNQLNLEFSAVEGTLYATRLGDVAGTDRTTSKVLSESTTATDWLKVYDGTTTEGVQTDALTSIQEKVDFVSNDKIKEIGSGGRNYVAITYYFYYVLPANAVANAITLTAPAISDSAIAITYSYVKGTDATLPAFTTATDLADGSSVTVSGGEHVFIKAEAKVNLAKSVKIESADWNFTLDFGVYTYSLTNGVLNFPAVVGAETYEVWAKQDTTSSASLLRQASAVGDADTTLGTLVTILDKNTTSVDLAETFKGKTSGTYTVTVLPKDASGVEIANNRVQVKYEYSPIKVTDTPIGGNYFYYVELGEYPQTVVEDSSLVAALNALSDTAKTGRSFVIGGGRDSDQTEQVEYAYKGAKYVKVASADVNGTGDEYKFSTGTKAASGSTYWFKVEPIKWYLLEAYSTTKTAYAGSTTNLRVLSEKRLTSNVVMDSDVEVYSWNTSNMRAWLNDVFYVNVFSAGDKACIVKNTTRYFDAIIDDMSEEYEKPDDYTVTTGGVTTEDYVWLTSYYEMGNTYYGDNMYLNKNGRAAQTTDFAIANGAQMDANGCGFYWLRSPGYDQYCACGVDYNGNIGYGVGMYYSGYGIRPALTISI